MRMKKKIIGVLSVCMLAGLVSCGGNGEPTPQPTVKIELGYEATDVLALLENMGQNGNYTLEYVYSDGVTYHEYYTPNYAYFEATAQGYVGVEDYNNPAEKLFYIFSENNKNVLPLST